MKRSLILILLAFTVFACKKNNGGGNGGGSNGGGGNGGGGGNTNLDYTPIPNSENVNTEIAGYVTDDQNNVLPGVNLFHFLNGDYSAGAYNILGNGTFSTTTLSKDKYRTRTAAEPGGGWNNMLTEQNFALTNASRNYVRIKVLSRNSIGSVRNDQGGTFNLINGNGSSITYGINSFYQTPTQIYPGYFGPEIVSGIYITYLDPENKDFGLRLPSYLAGDDNQKRWFLKSYGAITFRMWKDGVSGDNIDFRGGYTADLKLNIPSSMQSGAPDSVIAWKLVNGVWLNSGWAKKQGNFYTAKVDKTTAWTFAEPQKGVYMNLNLRTDSNAILINTAVRIRMNNRVIAESRTDADGNAVFFVPTYENLIAEVIPEERVYSPNTYTFPIGSITKTTTVTIKLPNSTPEIGSLIANVLDCNGNPITNGTAKIRLDALGHEYIIPVKNGKMGAGIWLYGTNNGIRVQITDNTTGAQGDLTPLTLFMGDLQHVNLYSCPNSPLLYCNLMVDNNYYELRDNANSANVFLTGIRANPLAPPLTLNMTSNNKGINLISSGIFMATITTGLITDLYINGAPYNYDPSINPVFSTTRYDGAMNGFIEGCMIFYYKDNGNVQHRVEANYKVKRLF